MRKRKAGHDLVQSTIRLEPIAIWDSETLLPVSGTELNSTCVDFLMDIASIQNQLIQANHQSLPHRTNDQFGAKWARDHIKGTTANLIPENYIERYWTLTGCKIEAARIILAWQHRRDLAEWLEQTQWEGSFAEAKKQLGGKWLDYQLYQNVKRSRSMPAVPIVNVARFPFNQMNAQVVQQETYQDILWLHNMAVGSVRYDIVFDAAPIWRRYRNVVEVSRPTLFMAENDEMGYRALFDFAVKEDIVKQEKSKHHAVGFDRNMDHSRVISGSRVNADGTVSRELGPSVRTLDLCQSVSVRQTELARKRKKLGRLMPWQHRKADVLGQEIEELRACIDRLHDEIDASVAADIVGHCRPGDTVGLEYLRWAGGGPVKCRHGRSDETITHALDRAGVSHVMVRAAGTTADCPVCGEKLSIDESTRVVSCPGCDFRGDRDSASGPVVAVRTLSRVSGRKEPCLDCSAVSCEGVGERSSWKRRSRERKMERRRARGSRTYRVKGSPSPRRPRVVSSGVCVGDDGVVSHVGVSDVGAGASRVVGSSSGSGLSYVVSVGSGEVLGCFVSRKEFEYRRSCELRAWREFLDRLAAGSFDDGSRPFLGAVAGASVHPNGTWAKANALHSSRYGQETCYAYLRYHLHLRDIPPPTGENTANTTNNED